MVQIASQDWRRRQVSDRKVAASMPVVGTTLLESLKKTHKAIFLTGTLCDVKD